eukprot:7552609-Pyramimonas_sp.AAC.1
MLESGVLRAYIILVIITLAIILFVTMGVWLMSLERAYERVVLGISAYVAGIGPAMATRRKGSKHEPFGHLQSGAQLASWELSVRSTGATKAIWSARAATRTKSRRSEAPPAGGESVPHPGPSHQLDSVNSTIERPLPQSASSNGPEALGL